MFTSLHRAIVVVMTSSRFADEDLPRLENSTQADRLRVTVAEAETEIQAWIENTARKMLMKGILIIGSPLRGIGRETGAATAKMK